MNIKTKTYELKLLEHNYNNTKSRDELDEMSRTFNVKYSRMVKALREISIMHSHHTQSDISEMFLMPGNDITLIIRSSDDHDYTIYMDIISRCRHQPKYINEILEKLGGVDTGSSSIIPFNPAQTMDLYLKGNKK